MDNNFLPELPIEHVSYSALRIFCANPQQFLKEYILQIRDRKSSLTAVVGRGFHKAMELYYLTGDWDKGVQRGYDQIASVPDKDIDYGKTGSREKILSNYAQALQHYRLEEPKFGEILGCEINSTTDIDYEGNALPLPVKAITDLVCRIDGKLVMVDHKTVSAFSDKEKQKGDYYMQAVFNYMTVKARYNEAPTKMIFNELKVSKNKDGRSQLDPYEVDFVKHPEVFLYFNKMYAGFLMNIANPHFQYLPNFSDTWTGQDAWEDFAKGVIDFSTFVPTTHKNPNKSVVPDIQFQQSSINSVEAKTASPEDKVEMKLREFGIPVQVKETHVGANVTTYACEPAAGISMKKISAFEKDIAIALAAKSVRIEAPIPGTHYVGIEVANKNQGIITWGEELVVPNTLMLPIGRDVYKQDFSVDLAKAPHLLIAGSTGSGKSVAMHMYIKTMIKQNSADALRLVLIDPKRTEFSVFKNEPHVEGDILTESETASAALLWALDEMEARYKILEQAGVRDITQYNALGNPLPKVVIVIDELADLLLTKDTREEVLDPGFDPDIQRDSVIRAMLHKGESIKKREPKIKTIKLSQEIENSIIRLAQKARAAGIHLIIATQRPSVDVITGLMKANFVTRIAFMTASTADSQVILDEPGAENLIGNGDCLLKSPLNKGLVRLQSYYIS